MKIFFGPLIMMSPILSSFINWLEQARSNVVEDLLDEALAASVRLSSGFSVSQRCSTTPRISLRDRRIDLVDAVEVEAVDQPVVDRLLQGLLTWRYWDRPRATPRARGAGVVAARGPAKARGPRPRRLALPGDPPAGVA
ncbi:MAG: hypothetical protein U0800_06310 [Isosphaeraceae bacterium]